MELSEYFFRFSHKEVAIMSVLGRILFTGQVFRFSKVSRKLISSQIFASNALQQTPPPPANKTFKILIWRHGMKLENRSAAHFVTDQGYNLPHPGTCTPILIPRGTLGRAVHWGDCQERGIYYFNIVKNMNFGAINAVFGPKIQFFWWGRKTRGLLRKIVSRNCELTYFEANMWSADAVVFHLHKVYLVNSHIFRRGVIRQNHPSKKLHHKTLVVCIKLTRLEAREIEDMHESRKRKSWQRYALMLNK